MRATWEGDGTLRVELSDDGSVKDAVIPEGDVGVELDDEQAKALKKRLSDLKDQGHVVKVSQSEKSGSDEGEATS